MKLALNMDLFLVMVKNFWFSEAVLHCRFTGELLVIRYLAETKYATRWNLFEDAIILKSNTVADAAAWI